jgi:UDP:flavonoid glycosyltransferase YjiC (YdhE family)
MISILALGSRGDVQPFISLGKALQAAGRRVRLVSLVSYEPMAREAGLSFHPVQGDAEVLVQLAAQGGFFSGSRNLIRVWRALQRSYGQLAASLPEEIERLDDTELLLNQLPAHLFGPELSEHLGIRWAVVSVIPLTRSRHRPLIGFPSWPGWLPGYNTLTYRLGEQIGWQLFRKGVNRLRERWGLPRQSFWGPYEAIQHQRVPVICGYSPIVSPPAPDWGDHIHLTGWWLPQEPTWKRPNDLVRFLEAGSPPVFVGFGSMPLPDAGATAELVIEAAHLAGVRLILHSGWGGMGRHLAFLPPTVYRLDYAPYGWLFPRMAAIVHHGGSGTTGFALHSGVPSLVVPFAFDQFYWGKRTEELSAGPPPLPFLELTSVKLADQIAAAVSDPLLRSGARELGAALQKEDGLSKASQIILNL